MKKKIFKYICLILYIICSTLIIVHSSFNGNASSNESNKVVNIFSYVLNKITRENNVYIDATDIELNTSLDKMYLGEKVTLDLNVLPSDASNKSLSFSSSDDSVASISSNGTLEFNSLGECDITITSNANKDVKLVKHVNVVYPEIKDYKIYIDGNEYAENMLVSSSSYHYIDIVSDTNIYKKEFTSTFTEVNEYGAFYLGDSTTNFSMGVNLNDNIDVTLKFTLGSEKKNESVSSYTLSSFYEKLYVNGIYNLNYSFLPTSSNKHDLYYKIDSEYGEVKDDKLYIYKASENLNLEVISRSSSTILYKTSLTTYDVFPSEIIINNKLDNDILSLSVLSSTLLNISFNEEATYKNVKYESGDTSILVIDNNGLIRTLEKGETYIKVSLDYDSKHLEKIIKVNVTRQPYIRDLDTFSYFVRKLVGHFGLFLAMSLFGTLTYLMFIKKKYLAYPISIGVSFILASSSEIIQIFAGNRGPSFKDVGIDMLGASIPFLIILVIDMIIYLHKTKKSIKEEL